jgi:hypothetical protein
MKVILHMGFVGTLGYVMSEMKDGKKLSEVVKTAKSLGYTEPGLTIIMLMFLHYNIKMCVNFYLSLFLQSGTQTKTNNIVRKMGLIL